MRAHRTPRKTRCFTRRLTLSPGNLISGYETVKKKRQRTPGGSFRQSRGVVLAPLGSIWLTKGPPGDPMGDKTEKGCEKVVRGPSPGPPPGIHFNTFSRIPVILHFDAALCYNLCFCLPRYSKFVPRCCKNKAGDGLPTKTVPL